MSLGKLAVNSTNDAFTLDGEPFFWLADTCWSAFTNISEADWEYYLTRRAEQGFNVLQINTLPQWDRCRPDLGIYPYASEDGVVFDWTRPNSAYWERARAMCERAVAHGIRPALILMWCNYVPGTWGAALAARTGATLMPRAEIPAHVQRVYDYLGEFDPVYVISGDTDFKTDESIAYYEDTYAAIHALAGDGPLYTMHINRGNSTIPESLVDKLDFYMFQSGHNHAEQFNAYKLPEALAAKYPKKPMINAEPCYEMMGASRNVYWRFSAQDVRAAAWTSIFDGAYAGVTYGAHGIWNWQTAVSTGSILGEGFDAPFRWYEALQLPGAWDYGALSGMLDLLGTRAPQPAQDELDDTRDEIRLARISADDASPAYAAYMPRATKLKIKGELAGATAVAIDLENKRVARLPVKVGDGVTVVSQHPFTADALLVVR